jgi:hypothetical protein
MWGRKKKKEPSIADVATEGGCCLLEIFAVATCLTGFVLIPLLVR